MSIFKWFKRMGRPSTTVPKKKIDTLGQKLEEMAKNPQKVSLRDLVYELLPKIKEVQDAGYTLEEIAKAFSDEEVTISASSLKLYLKQSQSKEPIKPQSKAVTSTEVKPPAQSLPQIQPTSAEPEIEPEIEPEAEQTTVDDRKRKKYKDQSEVAGQFSHRSRGEQE